MPEATRTALCVVCSDPVDTTHAHSLHEPGCPNDGRRATTLCACDLYAHADCCPACAEANP